MPSSLTRLGVACAARQHTDLWKLLLISYFISLGFHQVLKPFCAGEQNGLPDDSQIARVYPCNAHIFRQAWVLLTHPFAFWRDLARVKLHEKWATVETYFLLPRIACALLLPRHIYESIAPVLAAVHRGLGPFTLTALSFITTQRPSNLAIWGMRTWPFLDACFNAIFPTTPAVELVYGALSLSWMITLCLRYQHTFPDMQLQMPMKLMTCVISWAWLVTFQIYRRRAVFKKRYLEDALLDEPLARGSGSSSGAAAAAGAARAGCSTGSGPAPGLKPAGEQPHKLNDDDARCAPRGHVPYIALPGRCFSIHVKIDNAEPEQIRPGLSDRVARVLAAAGLRLQDLYVRRGCIELTVDAWTEVAEAAAAGDDCDVDVGALIRALQLDGREGEDHDEDAVDSRPLLPQEYTTETVLSAPDTTNDASSAESVSSSATGFGSDISNEPRLLATQCHPWASLQALGPDLQGVPRITALQPRVLAMPPSLPPAGPQSPAADIILSVSWPTCTASSAGTPDGRLTGFLHGAGVGSRELVLRSQGLYLPISVDYSEWPAAAGGSGAGASDGADACPHGRSDSSAAPDVEPRWSYVYSVQVAGLQPCAGLMLAEARVDGRYCSRPVPVLIVDDPRVATELAAAFAAWGGTADELDALLVDLGNIFSQVAAAARQRPQAPACGGAAAESASASSSALQAWRLVRMAEHLMLYALASNWEMTAERLRSDLQLLCQAHAAGLPSSGGSASSDPPVLGGEEIEPCPPACEAGISRDAGLCASGPAEARGGCEPGHGGQAAPEAEAASRCCRAAANPPQGGERALGGPCQVNADPRLAAPAAGGLAREADAVVASWSVEAGLHIHVLFFELALLLALPLLRWRERHPAAAAAAAGGGGAAAAVVLGGVAAAAACSYLLRAADVEALLRRAAPPRLALYLLVRSLQCALGLAAPPAVQAYERGVALFLVEGILRPAFLMVGPTAAVSTEALKLPLYVLLWGRSFALWSAVGRAAVTAGLSVMTSCACARLLRNHGAPRATLCALGV